MPTKDELHLPFYMDWVDIYKDCQKDMKDNELVPLSNCQLSHLRNTYFPKLKKPKFTRQGKCDYCLQLKDAISKTKNLSERLLLQRQKINHNEKQKEERSNYYNRILLSKEYPRNYMSLIIDGMATTYLPMQRPIPKGTTGIKRLKYHIIGLINNGVNDKNLFGTYEYWTIGANVIGSILLNYIIKYKINNNNLLWPSTLYLQGDNSPKEIRNKGFLTAIGILLEFGWFKTIYLDCLPPGHTHENIDQMFSAFNTHFWKRGLESSNNIPRFLEEAYNSTETRPKWNIIDKVYDLMTVAENCMTNIWGYSSSDFRSYKVIN